MTSGKPGSSSWIFFEHVEVERLAALELVGAVAGADGAGEGVAAGLLDEVLGLVGIGEGGVAVLDLDVLLDAAEHAELGLDARGPWRGRASTTRLVIATFFVERLVRGVDHHRAVEARLDAVVAGLLVAVVEVDGEDGLGKDLARRADDGLEHALVGVFARALGDLDDEGRLRLRCSRGTGPWPARRC